MGTTAKNPAIRGRHVHLKIGTEEGEVKVWTVNSLNDSEDAELDAKGYLGLRSKLASREHNGWEGDFDFDLANGAAIDLEEKVIARDWNGQLPYRISLTKVIYFRDSTTKTITYTDLACKFRFSSPNREGYVHCSATFRADTRSVT